MAKTNPSAPPTVNVSAPDLATLMGLASAGSISTTGPDVWGTGTPGSSSDYGDLTVNLGRTQTSGPAGFLASIFNGKMVSNPQSAVDTNPGEHFEARTFGNQSATVNQVLAAGYKMSPDDLKQLQQKLWLAGMYQGTGVASPSQIPYGSYDESTIAAYGNLLKLSATQVARGQDVQLDDTLNQLIQQRTATGQASGTTSRTSASYSLSDPETAKSILTNVMQAYTGVGVPDGPTLAAFQQALNSYEKAHPSTSTSTYSADGSGAGNDTSTEGVNSLSSAGRTQFAQDFLFQNQGDQVANYQAATTYYQAALQALQAPVSLGSNG